MDQKKKISAKEIVSDIKNGLDDDALMAKFGLARKQLDVLFKKLVAAGYLSQADLDVRRTGSDDLVEIEPDVPSLAVPDSQSAQSSSSAVYAEPGPVEPPSVSPSYSVRAAIGITIGIIVQIIGPIVNFQAQAPTGTGALISLGGTALLLWGCYYLVKKKGYHGALCLLGILGCFGALVLLAFPSKDKKEPSWVPAIVVMAAIGFVGFIVMPIILAIAIPYYVSYKRTSCDRAATGDLAKFGACLERLGNEIRDDALSWDEKSVGELASKNGIGYLVGPYYGWGGCSKKCGVLVRMNKEDRGWVAESVALKGGHPQGSASRYVYRIRAIDGKDLPAKVIQNVTDTRDGAAESWNSYPLDDKCYTGSLVQKLGGPDIALFSIKAPRSRPCSTLRGPE